MSTDDETAMDHAGPYRLLSRLGEGGMGVVYRAVDEDGAEAAVKVLRSELAADMTFRRRLAREVDTMRRIRSGRVARVLDADVAAERPYIATEFIAGHALDDTVRATGPLSGRLLGRVATGLAEALDAIHDAGVIHRDLKPNNVMLIEGSPTVIDFGIAQAAGNTRLTQTGMVIGTPGYLAPELIDGKEPGPAVDVYAWAATVAFAATGRPPFDGASLQAVLARIIQGTPDLDGVPAQLEPVLRAALVREPESRPSASQLATWMRGLELSETASFTAPHPTPYTARMMQPPVPPMPMSPPPMSPTLAGPPPMGPPPMGPPPMGPPATSARPRPDAPRVALGWYKLSAYLAIGTVVCVAAMLPVVTGVVAVLAAGYLRAGDSAVRSRRVPVRGARDLALAPLRLPGSLGRATALALPCLLYSMLAGGIVLGALVVASASAGPESGTDPGTICQWTAVAFTYVTLAGPGLLGPRRQMVRLTSALALDRRTTAVAGLGTAAAFLLAAGLAWLLWPNWWPAGDPYETLNDLLRSVRDGMNS